MGWLVVLGKLPMRVLNSGGSTVHRGIEPVLGDKVAAVEVGGAAAAGVTAGWWNC